MHTNKYQNWKRYTISKDDVINRFKVFYEKYHKSPSMSTWNERPSPRSICRHFGGWDNALKAANLPLNYNPNIVDVSCVCSHCGKKFNRFESQMRYSKNLFCSQSCAATYNNTHKTYGIRRSKLEVWLAQELLKFYPNLEFHFNRKDAINSELDIYIPSLKLAFELNGIYHYEPIHGADTLTKIQNNDSRKFQACLELGIELCIIDTSMITYFKINRCQSYYNIIKNIIDNKIGSSSGS